MKEIPGESNAEFKRRVERVYKYEIQADEKWCLWGDLLIVAHPDRQPLSVLEGGERRPIVPYAMIAHDFDKRVL